MKPPRPSLTCFHQLALLPENLREGDGACRAGGRRRGLHGSLRVLRVSHGQSPAAARGSQGSSVLPLRGRREAPAAAGLQREPGQGHGEHRGGSSGSCPRPGSEPQARSGRPEEAPGCLVPPSRAVEGEGRGWRRPEPRCDAAASSAPLRRPCLRPPPAAAGPQLGLNPFTSTPALGPWWSCSLTNTQPGWGLGGAVVGRCFIFFRDAGPGVNSQTRLTQLIRLYF